MIMKKLITRIRPLALALLAFMLATSVAMAAYAASILVKETSGVNYSMLAANVTLNVDHLVTNNYINADALDTRVEAGSDELPHMLASGNGSIGRLHFALPVGGSTAQTVQFTTGSSNLTHFPVIPGYSGNVTVADAANIELSDNFSVLFDGWIDTTVGSNKNPVLKTGAFEISAGKTVGGNVTASVFEAATVDRVPEAAGDYTNIANVQGAATHWEAVDDPPAVPDDIATYVWTVNNAQEKDAYNLQDFSSLVDANAGVQSVTVYFRFRSAAAVNVHAQPYLRLGGVETTGTEVVEGAAAWTTHNEVLARPGGGNWTPSDIDNLQVVIGIRSTGAHQAQCTQVYVQIGYTDVGTTISATGVSSGEHSCNVSSAPLLWGPGNTLHFTGGATSNINAGATSYNGTAKLWVSFWFQQDDLSGVQYLWGKRIDTPNRIAIYRTSNRLYFVKDTGGVIDFAIYRIETYVTGQWFHVLASISNVNAVRLRINNGPVVTDADVSAAPNGGNFVIGNLWDGYTLGLRGTIANFVAGTDDLTPAEEAALFYGTAPGDETDLWYIDEGAGTNIISYGSAPNTGTADFACTWQEEIRPSKFAIAIDGTSEGSFARPVTVPDTSDNWTMYQDNSLIYSDNLSIVVNGITELWFRPTSIVESIDATTGNLTDLTNVYNHGIITWGSNPLGVAVTMGGLVSDFAGAGDPAPLATPDIVPVVTTPITATDAAILVTLAGDPFYGLFDAVNSVTSISIVLMYQLALFFLAIVIFVSCYKLFSHLFLCGVLFCVPIGYGVALTVFPFTFIAVIIVVLIGSAVMEGRQPA